MAITRAQQARQMLEDGGMTKEIKGQKHMLAYITPGEAKTLENLGGQKTMTPEGIPAYPPPGKGASTGIGGSGEGTGKDQTGGGGGGGNDNDRDNLREQASVASTLGKKTPTMKEVREIVDRGPDDRGNFLQNRNQRNVVEYNKNLKKINENKDLNFIEKFNEKRKLKNKQFINNKFTQKAQGIADAYGLSVDQLKDLLDSYEEDSEDQIGFFSKMQDILDMDPSARNLGEDFNEDIIKGALGSIELSPRMKKGTSLSDAELFSTTDATTRIDLPGILGKLQGDPNFSNVLSGLNRLQTLDKISQLPDVKQSDIDNYFSLTMGKGGIDPITGKNVDALFTPIDDRGPSEENDPCKGPNPPAYCFIGGNAPTTPDPVFTPAFRFMNRGGMVEDAPMGGIMDLESTRQMLFIGGIAKSIGKGLKSITRGIKKVAKSPIGKAAILGTIGYGLGGGFGAGGFKFSNLPGMTSLSKKFSGFSLPDILTKNMTGLKVAGLSGLGGALLASLEDKDDGFNIDEYYKMAGIDIPENQYRFLAEGGDVEPVAKKTMPLLDMDGQEMDFREEGGFVPIGRMEKADDVPARLSKNEFVFTADAVRNAGEGDVDKGAEVMYNMMKNLESGGEVSEESQGLQGAREMFQTSQRLEEVI
jgi:hypothetical protein